jgi:formylglycine-generating enzyme required for sulfatase activity
MVAAGAVCIDKYEVSVWSSPTGGTQFGASGDNYPCADNGQNCDNIYARSVPGVKPSLYITYFQAQQALANSGKRLPTNAEWQQAVAGTPDVADDGLEACNTHTGHVVNTGSRSDCISRFGAMDMVGNAEEWVADWMPYSTNCGVWGAPEGGLFSTDQMCFAGTTLPASGPNALLRGGYFVLDSESSGPFQIEGLSPQKPTSQISFRGVR